MRIECRLGVALFCYLCGILLWHSNAIAQSRYHDGLLSPRNGGNNEAARMSPWLSRNVDSRTADWPPSPRSEVGILRFLASETEICLPGITIRQLVDRIERHAPAWLAAEEVDLHGVDVDSKIGRVPRGTVYAQLVAALNSFELTIHLRHGILVVTSIDDAESDPMIRTYEIAGTEPQRSYDFESLRHQLRMHVEPDRWLAGGGVSCMTIFQRNDRWLLVVSAPLSTQLKVSALLEQLLPLPARTQAQRAVPDRSQVLSHTPFPSTCRSEPAAIRAAASTGSGVADTHRRSGTSTSCLTRGHQMLPSSMDSLR